VLRLIKYCSYLIIFIIFLACSEESDSPTDPGGGTNYNPNGSWSLPIFLSGAFENKYNPSVTGDGKTMYCDSYDSFGQQIYVSTNDGNGWSQLTQLPFPNYHRPCISYDGNTLFIDNNQNIYRAVRSGNSWSTPEIVLEGADASITQDGKTMYYTKSSGNYSINIYYASFENGHWIEKGAISEVNSFGNVWNPGISGDGTLLFFTRNSSNQNRYYDIYYSKKTNNVWQTPVALNETINFTNENYTACISWDKMKLYYSTYTSYGVSGPKDGIYMATWINE